MPSHEFMEVLRGIPDFNAANSLELKTKMSMQRCHHMDNDKRFIAYEAPLEPILDADGKQIGLFGQCPKCKISYYYEEKE